MLLFPISFPFGNGVDMAGNGDSIPKRFRKVVTEHPRTASLMSKNGGEQFESITYQELYDTVKLYSLGLHTIGVKHGDHVGIISDNRKEWIATDLAILCIGGVDVPRGSDSTAEEIGFILRHADCAVSFAENQSQLDKIVSKKGEIPLLTHVIVYDPPKDPSAYEKSGITLLSFQELKQIGEKTIENNKAFFEQAIDKVGSEDVATLIYTSGTTGEPKGVILKHRCFIFQLDRIREYVPIEHGEIYMSILPAWHSFERAVEYVILDAGVTMAYSKLVAAVLLPDMQKVRPHWTAGVPRLWESVRASTYRKANNEGGINAVMFHFFVGVGGTFADLKNLFLGRIPVFKKRLRWLDIVLTIIPLILITPFKLLGDALVFSKLKALFGGRLIAAISGGGALPGYVDKFFQSAGITLLEGYGLTETAPVLTVRKFASPIPGTIGPLLRDIEHRIVADDMSVLEPGQKGVLYVKSPQIMDGYYKRPEATVEVLKDGWLNTGDIAMETLHGEFKILGRAKETIVLLGGENIEPLPLEDKLNQSEYIDQAMVVGQDQKFLGALIVPNFERIEQFAKESNLTYLDNTELLTVAEIQELLHSEVQALVNPKSGFKHFERIFRIKLLSKPFEVGRELTHTLKLKRNVITEIYAIALKELFR